MRISKKLKSAFQVLFGLAFGVAVGVGFAILTDEPGVDPNKAALKERFGIWLVVFAIALAIIYGFFVVAIHELGHIAGGLIARFRFHFLIIGPIRFDRD